MQKNILSILIKFKIPRNLFKKKNSGVKLACAEIY